MFVLMHHDPTVIAEPLTAEEIDGLVGEPSYLQTLPCVRHVDACAEGRLVVWLEPRNSVEPALDEACPGRPPEVELHGQGAPVNALVAHPRAQHVEMFFDGLGDPEHAPLGWWHARVWLRPAA